MERLYNENCDYKNLSPLSLAFVGDCVFELFVREQLLCIGNCPVNKLHKKSVEKVCCTSQSLFIEKLLPVLSEEELAIYKRGRNAHTKNTPKNASESDYHNATGFEALLGYLYLKTDIKRLRELFSIIS
ncbi:MAG: Mini-ribonuclease 3 [Eubacteriales bacterium SKADARSKE-1]|nr:Mini-ribonuclease 3 [Eubacteriales bacterium SKADARSKE-1]